MWLYCVMYPASFRFDCLIDRLKGVYHEMPGCRFHFFEFRTPLTELKVSSLYLVRPPILAIGHQANMIN